MASRDQTLPGKEAALFRQIVKFYETKQYKKGIKAADQILKKHADHGETLAMKGLILNCQERNEEAYELVRRGLKSHLKSHVCWHVYGLLYRSDRNYDEAIKCYKNALRIEKENIQILRDLAQLQVQMRDISGFIDTRAQLLQLKPASRPNWITFAIAHHLKQNYELAAQALTAFESTQEEVSPAEAQEHSEMLMYKAMILEEGGSLEEALRHLDNHKESIRDRLGRLEQQSRLLLRLGRKDEAVAAYRGLIMINADNYRYHEGLQAAMGLHSHSTARLNANAVQRLSELYGELATTFPSSKAVRRIPLNFLEGPEFEAAAEAYVRPFLDKGIPSLFSSLKALYSNPAKVDALGRLFERLRREEEACAQGGQGCPKAVDGCANGVASSGPGEQDVHLWVLFYLAQHYDRLGRTGEALAALNLCEEHTPELPDILSARARVLKHAGDPAGAAAAAVRAQQFDLSDRYLNSAAAKALFRAGNIGGAERMAARFTKDGDQPNNLTEMQAMWYEIEAGTAHARRGEHGMALKRLLAVRAHFDDFVEDQFDFHSYCVRKMTLRAYVAMLRMEDRLHRNAPFVKAAGEAVAVYLALDGRPAAAAAQDKADRAAQSALSPEDRKKLRQKQKKEQQKQQKKEREAQGGGAGGGLGTKEGGAAPRKGTKDGGAAPKEDADPHGAALASVPDPLAEAAALVRLLRENAADQLRTHELAFEVYMRRGRLLLALQAVQRAVALDSAAPIAHRLLATLAHAARDKVPASHEARTPNGLAADNELMAEGRDPDTPHSASPQGADTVPAVVRSVVDARLARLLGDQPLDAYCEAWAQQHAGRSLLHRAAAAEAAARIHPERRAAAVSLVLEGEASSLAMPCHADCVAVHTLLGETLANEAAAAQWHERCQRLFPWSQYFAGSKRWQPQGEGAAAGAAA